MKRNGIAGILAAVLLSAWSLPAGAEETYKLDPVLVTAEKRTENVQDVPVSVTAISEQQIKDSGIRSIQDVGRFRTCSSPIGGSGATRTPSYAASGPSTTTRPSAFMWTT